jgi:hypothetical protein
MRKLIKKILPFVIFYTTWMTILVYGFLHITVYNN